MALHISQSATFYKEGDIIIANIYLADSDDQTHFKTSQVDKGIVTLYAGDSLQCELELDSRHICQDGAFHVVINHPMHLLGWKIKTDLKLVDGSELSHTTTVIQAVGEQEKTDAIPLMEQPITTNPGWSDQQRIKENL